MYRNYEIHAKKIQKYTEEIHRIKVSQNRQQSPTNEALAWDEKARQMQVTMARNRMQSRTFHQAEKTQEIQKANRGLAAKLFEIQLGKVTT